MHRRPTGTRTRLAARAGALLAAVVLAASCGGVVRQRRHVDEPVRHDGGLQTRRSLDPLADVDELADGVGLLGALAVDGDGRIVLGISAPCDACVPDDPWSASVVSFLPDGSDLQVVATGIRAPVGLAWWPADDGSADGALLVSMDQQDDLGDATPGDWLAVVDDGQDWGFPDCWGQDATACAGTP